MNKPNGYDEARETGSFTPVELGGHFAVIKQVAERDTKNGKPMVVVIFDFMAPDKQPDYFANAFEADDREEKKWPFNGTKYIMVQDFNDASKTSRAFKSFITCFEKSNNVTIKWGGSDWGKQFKGKKIGVVFGEEEHEYDGETSMRRVPKFFCEFDKVKDAGVPTAKYLPKATKPTATAPVEGFSLINDDEIPF